MISETVKGETHEARLKRTVLDNIAQVIVIGGVKDNSRHCYQNTIFRYTSNFRNLIIGQPWPHWNVIRDPDKWSHTLEAEHWKDSRRPLEEPKKYSVITNCDSAPILPHFRNIWCNLDHAHRWYREKLSSISPRGENWDQPAKWITRISLRPRTHRTAVCKRKAPLNAFLLPQPGNLD